MEIFSEGSVNLQKSEENGYLDGERRGSSSESPNTISGTILVSMKTF